MSKVCSVCGKKPGFGHNRSHSMVATNRRFDPNLQRVRMFVDGVARRAYVCTRCLKSQSNIGIKTAKPSKKQKPQLY
jgi:large subunit ribosomal protein L28